MTRIPGLDAYLTREGPTYTVDPHAPWTWVISFDPLSTWVEVVLGDPEEAGAALRVRGVSAAAAWARSLNAWHRHLYPVDPDPRSGQCRTCGDFHGGPVENLECPSCGFYWRAEPGARCPQCSYAGSPA